MPTIGFYLLMEDDDGGFILEDGSGVIMMEVPDLKLENYYSVRVGDGMSTGERIR